MNIVDLSDSLVTVQMSLSKTVLSYYHKLANTKKVMSGSINIPDIIDRDRGVTNWFWFLMTGHLTLFLACFSVISSSS